MTYCLNIFLAVNLVSIPLSAYASLEEVQKRPRVAIVGGGIGGTTAAYELTQLAVRHGLDLHLDLYEFDKIGGRLATAFVNGFEFETGGSIIHVENKYMQSFVNKFNLRKRPIPEDNKKTDIFGFYDGHEFVFKQSSYDILSALRFWWRYGWDLFSLGSTLITPLLTQFKRIYELQAEEEAFDDIHSLLSALHPSFPPLLKRSTKDLLLSQGYSELFIDEFVFIATNVNYNQDTDIHGFVGSVALAGVGESLWSVEGGNKKVPEALLVHSDANLIKKRVQSVSLTPNSKYALQVDNETHLYDYVIIACPLMVGPTNIEFKGFPEEIQAPVIYHKTVATLVHGVLNHTYFNVKSTDLPCQIFSVNNSLFFNSISILEPVVPDTNYDRRVYKVFSKERLSDHQLNSLFLTYDSLTIIDWLAYPQYDLYNRNMTFVLHDNFFYINSVEWAASAMEMSALSGVNTALLVLKRMKLNSHHVMNAREKA